ncbi:MAG: hypothetical protein Q8O07_04630, partial [Chloroflexota bacterium]|nr:hypothetical protein [Chloroflexota bacterium]
MSRLSSRTRAADTTPLGDYQPGHRSPCRAPSAALKGILRPSSPPAHSQCCEAIRLHTEVRPMSASRSLVGLLIATLALF